MKNRWRTISTLSLGVTLAIGMMISTVEASEADTSTEVKEDSKLLDINLPNLPILGDVKVTIPAKKTDDKDQSLLSVEVTDGILDELNVDVGAESETVDGGIKKSLATVEVKSAVTNDVDVDVISGNQQKGSFDGGLVEVNAEDLPLLGETHVGVLDKHMVEDGDNKSVSTGLVQVDVDGDLLEKASVKVLAAEKNNEADENESMTAVADVSIGGGALEGLVEDVDVSVLRDRKVKNESVEQSTSSVVSVGLESSLINDVNVDVGLQDRNVEGEASSFDGGLVEVNAEDLPLLVETHVGVLDKHVNAYEDGRTFSTGLAQVGLDGDLLKDTTIDVLYQNGAMTEDGLLVTSGVVGTNLDLLGLEPVAVDVLKREALFPVNTENPPSTGGGDDDNENTVPPTVIDPVPGDGNGDGNGNGNTIPPTVIDPAPGNGDGNENEDGNSVPPTVIVPAPGDEDDSSNGNGNGNGNGNEGTDGNDNGSLDPNGSEDGTAVVPGDGFGIPPATESGEVDADSGNRGNGTDSNLVPSEDSSSAAPEGTVLSAHAPRDGMTQGNMNSQSMRGALPQTGGTFDGKRLLMIAVVFLIVGVGLRRIGKSGQSAA